MSANGLETNISELFENFKQLTVKEMDKGVKRALITAANEIKKKTIQNAESGIKRYNTHPNDKYNGDSILDAPRVSKIQDEYDSEQLMIKVHVMGTQKKDSQTYRFRFLEKGTKDRYVYKQKDKNGIVRTLKKPRYIGSINGRRWFKQANEEVNVEQIYLSEIEKAINNINNK